MKLASRLVLALALVMFFIAAIRLDHEPGFALWSGIGLVFLGCLLTYLSRPKPEVPQGNPYER